MNSRFPSTPISLINRYQHGKKGEISTFLEIYRRPIILAFHKNLPENRQQDAEDWAQDFICEKLLTGNLLENWREERGRLRSYIEKAAKYYCINRWEKEAAQKRGGKHQHISLEPPHSEHLKKDVDFSDFDRLWAKETLERALREIEDIYSTKAKRGEFRVLLALYIGEDCDSSIETISSWNALCPRTKSRRKQLFKELLKQQIEKIISLTVTSEEERHEEKLFLLNVLLDD